MGAFMKLTAKNAHTLPLPSGKADYIAWDDDLPGFGLRLREGGSRTLVFQYKAGNQQHRMNLGAVSAVDFDKARKTAKSLYHRVKLGEDPASDKAEAKIKVAETLGATIKLYLARQKGRLKPRSLVEVERHLLVYVRPLHSLPLAKIERRTIASRLSEIAQDSGTVTANRVRASLSALCSWAIQAGMLDANPVTGTAREPERSRDRVLSANELKVIWNALADDHFGAIIKLLALTGARANEIAALRWDEVHDDMIVLPSERTKNSRAHIIPLSKPARAIIAAQPRRLDADGKPRGLIFGLGEGAFAGWGKSRQQLNEQILNKTGKSLNHWTPHDIRRSVATHMAEEITIPPHVIEAVLNHVSDHRAGVAGIYNRASYSAEKRQALDRWADHLMAIVEGRDSNIVTLQREA
jgi:integrase